LQIPNVQGVNAGAYGVEVSNVVGTASAAAILTVNSPPVIQVQPQSTISGVGGGATFMVVAEGTGPLSYQWRHNGANIPGANASAFAILSAKEADSGNYSVVVSNLVRSTISEPAQFLINTPITILQQPPSATIIAGNTIAFTVTASGSA